MYEMLELDPYAYRREKGIAILERMNSSDVIINYLKKYNITKKLLIKAADEIEKNRFVYIYHNGEIYIPKRIK